MDTQFIIYLVPVSGLLALGYALLRARWVGQQDAGNDRMMEIAAAISEGARAFLSHEYRVLGVFVVAVATLLVGVNMSNEQSSPLVAVSFVTGALCSALAGFIGMTVATKANVRTTQAARTGLASALGAMHVKHQRHVEQRRQHQPSRRGQPVVNRHHVEGLAAMASGHTVGPQDVR